MIVTTPRLRLMPVRSTDVDVLHRIWTDADVRRYLWDDVAIDRETARAVVDATVTDWQERGYGLFLIEENAQIVGFVGFRSSPDAPELLYGLLPTAWHRGIATEASQAALDWLFANTDIPSVIAATDVPNAASVRVMERLGMTFDREEVVEGRPTVFYRLARHARP